MIEVVIAIAVLVVIVFFAFNVADDPARRGEEGMPPGSAFAWVLFGAIALYCVIRFVRWAWETPMPFLGHQV